MDSPSYGRQNRRQLVCLATPMTTRVKGGRSFNKQPFHWRLIASSKQKFPGYFIEFNGPSCLLDSTLLHHLCAHVLVHWQGSQNSFPTSKLCMFANQLWCSLQTSYNFSVEDFERYRSERHQMPTFSHWFVWHHWMLIVFEYSIIRAVYTGSAASSASYLSNADSRRYCQGKQAGN